MWNKITRVKCAVEPASKFSDFYATKVFSPMLSIRCTQPLAKKPGPSQNEDRPYRCTNDCSYAHVRCGSQVLYGQLQLHSAHLTGFFFCSIVTHASFFGDFVNRTMLALGISEWEVFYVRTDQIQKRNKNGCTWWLDDDH